jgi:hypothetical protein
VDDPGMVASSKTVAVPETVTEPRTVVAPMKTYIVLFKYKAEGEKKPGPIRQFRLYANDLEQAKRDATRYANYPDVEIIDIKLA